MVALANLRADFIRPLFECIFPGIGDNHYWRFEKWLEKDGVCESLLADARAFMGINQEVGP